MLSATTASTGACGTWTTPSVAAASVMLCDIVKAATALDQLPAAVRDDQQSQNEEQMIDSAEDVLEAEHEEGADELVRTRRGLARRRRERMA